MHVRFRRGASLLALLLAGCVGDIGSSENEKNGGADPDPQAFVPSAPTIHRLTTPQLQNTWIALFGEPLVVPTDLPNDDLLYGFTSIAAAGATISSLDAEKYENATYDVLDQVWGDAARRDALVGCAPTAVSDPCVREFLEDFAKKAWRRPVESAEIDSVLGVGEAVAADLGDVQLGVKYAAAAVLQSPSFVFRIEIGEPDAEREGELRYTSWEMASRLSYLLWDSPPDEGLMIAAETDALSNAEGVRLEAERMIDDPRARPALIRFFGDFLTMNKLDVLDKSPEKFPAFTPTLGPAMRIEIERMFENIVFEEQSDFRTLFTTRETYINEELAAVYGIPNITGPDFQPYVFADGDPRAGLLTTPGFLAVNSHKTQTSPTHRGRFVRLNLLCQDVPPPPPGVDTSLPEPAPGETQTLRQRLEVHREKPECRSCHQMMDPIGFAYENFDAIGSYRTVDENGLPIDSVTELNSDPVDGPIQMGELVAQLPEVGACIARRFYEHAGAHLATQHEEVAVEALVESFVSSNYDFKEMVVGLVINDGYRYAAPVEE
jgi:hypothetical protein